jgi:hypothetical protein
MKKENYTLTKPYKKLDRPISRDELIENRKQTYKYLRLSQTFIFHFCDHLYLAKEGGRKHKSNDRIRDATECSVCWKLTKIPKELKINAYKLINSYRDICFVLKVDDNIKNYPIENIYDMLEIEKRFYELIYVEYN